MSRHYLLPEKGNFYKANLHCHSTFSDGRLTVEQLKEAYMAQGYSIIAFTDHNTLVPHNELSDENFLSITGVEIDYNDYNDEKYPKGWAQIPVYHINFFSKDKDRNEFIPFERVYSFDAVQKTIDDANKAGFLCQYNHPRWSYQTIRDFENLRGLFGFEIFNFGCETEMHNGWGDYEYDHYMRCGGKAAAVATDDTHFFCQDFNSPYTDCFGGYTMIKAPSLKYEDVMGAMERMECYASTGAEIYSLYLDDNEEGQPVKLHIECSPCHSVSVLSDVRETRIIRSFKDDITVVDVELKPDYNSFRVECMTLDHKRAFSRGFFREEFN